MRPLGSLRNTAQSAHAASVFLPVQRPSRQGDLSGWAPAIRQTTRQLFGPLFPESYTP
jgi:hypothetical protein